MYYFAYGSNMSVRRLQQRLPEAELLGSALLPRHEVIFHKIGSEDGSGKCGLIGSPHPERVAHGVVFTIHDQNLALLDDIEGVGNGYVRQQIEIMMPDLGQIEAATYLATLLDDSLKPFHWYKHHVLTGALENRLPAHHIRHIENLESIADPDPARHAHEMRIYE